VRLDADFANALAPLRSRRERVNRCSIMPNPTPMASITTNQADIPTSHSTAGRRMPSNAHGGQRSGSPAAYGCGSAPGSHRRPDPGSSRAVRIP
jgi:hypothetical protein